MQDFVLWSKCSGTLRFNRQPMQPLIGKKKGIPNVFNAGEKAQDTTSTGSFSWAEYPTSGGVSGRFPWKSSNTYQSEQGVPKNAAVSFATLRLMASSDIAFSRLHFNNSCLSAWFSCSSLMIWFCRVVSVCGKFITPHFSRYLYYKRGYGNWTSKKEQTFLCKRAKTDSIRDSRFNYQHAVQFSDLAGEKRAPYNIIAKN